MKGSQKRLVLGVLALSSYLLLIGLNAFEINEGATRLILTFVVSPLLLLFAKFLALGWSDLKVRLLETDGLIFLGAVLFHLMFTDYSGRTYPSSEIVEDLLMAEPSVGQSLGMWLGLVLPCIVVSAFLFRQYADVITGPVEGSSETDSSET
jgi:hypothetical protein